MELPSFSWLPVVFDPFVGDAMRDVRRIRHRMYTWLPAIFSVQENANECQKLQLQPSHWNME